MLVSALSPNNRTVSSVNATIRSPKVVTMITSFGITNLHRSIFLRNASCRLLCARLVPRAFNRGESDYLKKLSGLITGVTILEDFIRQARRGEFTSRHQLTGDRERFKQMNEIDHPGTDGLC